MYAHSQYRSEQKPFTNLGKSIWGRLRGLSKLFRAAIYWAHRAVVFAIARLSCCKCVDFVNNPLLNCFCVSFHSVCSVTVYKRLCCSHVRAGKLRPTKNILYTILPVTTFLLIITYIVTLLQLHIAYLYQIAPCRSQLLVFFQKFQRSAAWPLDWTKNTGGTLA